ncbi:hypothetical protein [Nitrosomonas supralitoralis]|uniref:hypothetical protein n=1 Tax=Nitrosomonas supralitoralis TaxID=2116706 RepID=UPI0018D4E82E|nr:hypothetical protein [Nitrosomonas supralitoralis]
MPTSNNKLTKKPGLLASLGIQRKRWKSEYLSPAQEIQPADTFLYGSGITTIASLLGSGKKSARSRQQIYNKWSEMESDAVVSSALKLLVTSALGGHETNGDIVFMETTPAASKDKRLIRIVEETAEDLQPIFNRIAFQTAYIGAVFGDAYGRVYTDNRGVIDVSTDEMVRPPMVQPFERGNRTVGYAVFTGRRNFERLDVSQMARLKMSRTQWTPQYGVVEKSLRIAITEDDLNELPLMPSMAGGSLLYNAEEAYNNFNSTLLGMVSQRWKASLDHRIVGLQMQNMTKEQQDRFMASVVSMYKDIKGIVAEAIENGRSIPETVTSILPMYADKQLVSISSADKSTMQSIIIDDVMIHARLLSGAIGVDLSMLGFADQLAGGLGEGGFFRTSAQAAENARMIRSSLADMFNQIIDIHTMKRYGIVFNERDRPWSINFFGSISALEAEKQRTKADSMNSGLLLAQSIQMMKDMGATEEIMAEFLTKNMMLDDDQAKLFATIVKVKNDPEGEGGDFGGGFGGNKGNFSGENNQ